MKIDLFFHNQPTYDVALDMLGKTRRVTVVPRPAKEKASQPSNSVRSIPKVRLLAIPSEYIFKTQQENPLSCGADVLWNITFYTYAKLVLLSGEELFGRCSDYIILDEFHRCGAGI